MRTIFLLNGPPQSGKDTAGAILSLDYNCLTDKFAWPIRQMLAGVFGLLSADIERLKDQPFLDSMFTLRDYMKGFSEDYLKVYGGEGVFGKLLAQRIHAYQNNDQPIVITDCGFVEEAEVLVEEFPDSQFVIIQLHREGCDFSGDSRQYITLPGVPVHVVENNGSFKDLTTALSAIVEPYLMPLQTTS